MDNLKKETRGGRYGRLYADLLNHILEISNVEVRYRRAFLNELQTYCLKPRNRGCVSELEDMMELNVNNPKELARVVKEGIHLMYQKETAKRVLYALLNNLKI